MSVILMEKLGMVWNKGLHAWVDNDGLGWASKVQPELANKIDSLVADAIVTDLEELLRNVPMPTLSYEQIEGRIAELRGVK